MTDIAICGRDTIFCRMLELEMITLGYSTTRYPRGEGYRLWLIDLDTVDPTTHQGKLCIGYSRKDAKEADPNGICHAVLHRPFPTDRLEELVTSLLSPEHTLTRAKSNKSAHARLIQIDGRFELDGEPLVLTDAEKQVLQALYDHRGQAVCRTELCRLLGNESNDKLADVYICLLRRKLERPGVPRLLFTVRGVGYRLEAET